MEDRQIEQMAIAVLFASGEEMELEALALALEVDTQRLKDIIEGLSQRWRYEQAGLQIIRIEDKAQICTNAIYAPQIQRALAPQKTRTLSQSAMETLSIIAYRQPITRRDIESIRGVNCDYALQALQSRGLITVVGHADAVGRPRLMGTTSEFLRVFHLESLNDLPELEALGEQPEGDITRDNPEDGQLAFL